MSHSLVHSVSPPLETKNRRVCVTELVSLVAVSLACERAIESVGVSTGKGTDVTAKIYILGSTGEIDERSRLLLLNILADLARHIVSSIIICNQISQNGEY